MRERRNFIRNTLMAFAASLVPRILQPVVPELPPIHEEEVPIEVVLNIHDIATGNVDIKKVVLNFSKIEAEKIQTLISEIEIT